MTRAISPASKTPVFDNIASDDALALPPSRTGAGMALDMAMGARRERQKGRQAMVERHHGGIGPLEELWSPGQLAKDLTGKSLVDGMLLERVGPAALFCLPAASTPCMGGLLCAPSGKVGRRGNFCLLCVFLSSSGGEEAARRCTAIAMILKSRAHTATRKFSMSRMLQECSFTKLHGAHVTVHT